MTSCWPQCWRRPLHVHVEAPDAPDEREGAHRGDGVPAHGLDRERQRDRDRDHREAREHRREVERVRPAAPVVVREELQQPDRARLVGALGLDDEVAARPRRASSAPATAPAASIRDACDASSFGRRSASRALARPSLSGGSAPAPLHAAASDTQSARWPPRRSRASTMPSASDGSGEVSVRLHAEERPRQHARDAEDHERRPAEPAPPA